MCLLFQKQEETPVISNADVATKHTVEYANNLGFVNEAADLKDVTVRDKPSDYTDQKDILSLTHL